MPPGVQQRRRQRRRHQQQHGRHEQQRHHELDLRPGLGGVLAHPPLQGEAVVGFATGELVMFQQMGFGVAVALLIDATLIRSVLVPAAMELLGDRNWYLPRWLVVATPLRGRGGALKS